MHRSVFCFFILFFTSLYATAPNQDVHEFAGKHFLASYMDCDRGAIGNVEQMIAAMDEAVRASGATILDSKACIFEPNGVTMVYLLSESHASIHTYPEYGACFIDLFTCGDNCSSEEFDKILRSYLKPQQVNARLFIRNHDVAEIALP